MFGDGELERMATPTSILLERMADQPDTEEIDIAIRRMNDEHLAIYDAYIQWLGVLQSHLVETAGKETHREALKYAIEKTLPKFVEDYRGKPFRERVQMLASRLRAGESTFNVSETDDRVTFTLDPWSPTRLWRQPQTWLEEEPRNRNGDRYEYPCYGLFDGPASLATVSEAQDITGGRSDVPCYLATEVVSLEQKPIELLGYPLAIIDFPDGIDGETHLDVHKNPADVPGSVYERVGIAKPAAGITESPDEQVFEASELKRLGQPLSIQAEIAAEEGDKEHLRDLADRYDTN